MKTMNSATFWYQNFLNTVFFEFLSTALDNLNFTVPHQVLSRNKYSTKLS